ncbi:hypothetical protein QYE76_056316 [Lolium multiflorum]|uniref:CCHC-type domain-containing protein n=1 Tax=Lolium multiflorum TaxID=4521 RepID=A0AAD8T1D7_LOLMU|nr:hypothetical protein QYE76_056316 [Lolium multiflorum]
MPRAPPPTAPAPYTRSAPYSTPSNKPVSNVPNTKKSESAASTSGSSMSTTRNRDMNCHTCGGKGHFKRDCPNRKVMIVNEDNEYETGDDVDPYAPEDDDYATDGVDAYPSDARTIVVSQRALNVLPSASTQRCNLFQTKALVGPDKACKVIIDGGSCRNLASKELCTKLKLKYLPHPHPYYIQWLSDNGEMKVNHMVRVEFEIGPYKYSIDFDVVPMTELRRVSEEVPAGLPPLRGITCGGLMGHFGREKTLLMLADHFYWPKMRRDVDKYVKRCITCNKSKSKLKPHDLGASRSTPFEGGGGDDEDIPTTTLPPSLQDEDEAAVKLKYEEGASIARGGEKKLDMELDMELDKTTHGRARRSGRHARERRKKSRTAQHPVRPTATPARPVTGPVQPGDTPDPPRRQPDDTLMPTGRGTAEHFRTRSAGPVNRPGPPSPVLDQIYWVGYFRST